MVVLHPLSPMLQPKSSTFRKMHKVKARGSKKMTLDFGHFGVQTTEPGVLAATTVEALRRTLTRTLKRQGNVWIRVFPHRVVTAKPAEVRMGKGKGSPSHWVCDLKKGQILFEVAGVRPQKALEALATIMPKSPLKLKLIQHRATASPPTTDHL